MFRLLSTMSYFESIVAGYTISALSLPLFTHIPQKRLRLMNFADQHR
jgi:hypothetical protein